MKQISTTTMRYLMGLSFVENIFYSLVLTNAFILRPSASGVMKRCS